eukprot:15472336-Alexandrium_andersonii.AAC.1
MDTWRAHLAAASHAYWHTRRSLEEGGHLSPADLFQLLVTWAETRLRIRLGQRADQGYRYCTLNSVAVLLAQMLQPGSDPR